MKTNKQACSIAASVGEMVLQTRVSPRGQQLTRLDTLRSEIELLLAQACPDDELLYFLVDREQYALKSRLLAQHRRAPTHPLALLLTLTLFDKDTSLTETAEIWKLQLNRKSINGLRTAHCTRELLNLLREVTAHLARSSSFTDIARNREAYKKYVIDFRAEVGGGDLMPEKTFQGDFRMRSYRARLNEALELSVECSWRENLAVSAVRVSPYAGMKPRKTSEETRVDSCSVGSLKQLNVKKYRSGEQAVAFEFYDSELEVTIISSDSDSLSQSRRLIQEIPLEQEFELLIEESADEDHLFLLENDPLFQNWQRALLLNFH